MRSLFLLATLLVEPAHAWQDPKPAEEVQEREKEKPKAETPEEKAAGELFVRAVRSTEKGKAARFFEDRQAAYEDALKLFRRLAAEHPKGRYYGMAQFNVGVVLCANLERYDESLKEFDRLIQSDVNDKDSTGEIMSPFRNYRYHAWYHVSVIQDKQGRLGQAIEACFQMRRAYQSDCGTCSRNMEQSFQRDLAKLCGKVLPESQGSITNDDLTAALKKAGTGDEFLLEVGRASMKAGRTGEARAVLMLLTRDLPRSPGVVEARKLLEDLK